MQFSVLGSGSRGNSVYVESGSTAILIDAGFSGKQLQQRLRSVGRDIDRLKAVCITHEHTDHISGAGVISRRCSIPAYANEGTFMAAEKRMGTPYARVEFATGDTVEIGDLQIRSFRVSHDTADPVGFVINDGHTSLGCCTDTGKVSHLMAQRLCRCNALILEFNHNLEMLKNGPYPLPLQQRVRSSLGHLSNEDAADFLSQLLGDKLQYVIQAHLSEKNNSPELATKAVGDTAKQRPDIVMEIAPQDYALPMITL